MKKITFCLMQLLFYGCITVPIEIRKASREYARENYGGVCRYLSEYLRKAPDESDWKESLGNEKRAMVYFYMGLAERACNVRRMTKYPHDWEESAQFRLGYLAIWKSEREIASAEILSNYKKALELAPNLMCVYLHQGLELLLKGDLHDGRKNLDVFMDKVKSNSESEWRRQFGRRFESSEVVGFVENLRKRINESRDSEKAEIIKNSIMSWYRKELYKGSAAHEMHNMFDILMKQYPVRGFKFVLDVIDVKSEYDYLEATAECASRYFIVRNLNEEKLNLLKGRLREEGFSELCDIQDSSSIEVIDDRKVFVGNENVPIRICHRQIKSGNVLAVMLSETKGVCYCFVIGDRLKMKGLDQFL